MLLLYREHVRCRMRPDGRFTFHYASTLSHPVFLTPFTTSNLHSTMLLLYRGKKPFRFNGCPNLHSTMLLLYQIGASLQQSRPRIYIPLCFYFIRKRDEKSVPGTLYLHSTMLLLYLRPAQIVHHIQPDLHSTMLLLYLNWVLAALATAFIYIPLCFYFIAQQPTAVHYLLYDLHSTMLLLYRI